MHKKLRRILFILSVDIFKEVWYNVVAKAIANVAIRFAILLRRFLL